MRGVCHECLKPFDNDDVIEVVEDVWECPYCCYPNSKSDMGVE